MGPLGLSAARTHFSYTKFIRYRIPLLFCSYLPMAGTRRGMQPGQTTGMRLTFTGDRAKSWPLSACAGRAASSAHLSCEEYKPSRTSLTLFMPRPQRTCFVLLSWPFTSVVSQTQNLLASFEKRALDWRIRSRLFITFSCKWCLEIDFNITIREKTIKAVWAPARLAGRDRRPAWSWRSPGDHPIA